MVPELIRKADKMGRTSFKKVSRLAYQLCYIVIVISLSTKVYQCVQKYLTDSTYYETAVVEQAEVSFPDITLCSANSYGLKQDVLEVKK